MAYVIFFIFVFALVCALFGAWLYARARRWRDGKQVRARFERGVQAESRMQELLRVAGYELVDEQPQLQMTMRIDGVLKTYRLRPDAVARRGDQSFWVEMKTGKVATNPASRDTRRQLVEYYYGTDETPILFVNAELGTVQQVSFASLQRSESTETSVDEAVLSGVS